MLAPKTARKIWRGYRGLEEYAREVFPVEEANNGRTWMMEDDEMDDDYDDNGDSSRNSRAMSPEMDHDLMNGNGDLHTGI